MSLLGTDVSPSLSSRTLITVTNISTVAVFVTFVPALLLSVFFLALCPGFYNALTSWCKSRRSQAQTCSRPLCVYSSQSISRMGCKMSKQIHFIDIWVEGPRGRVLDCRHRRFKHQNCQQRRYTTANTSSLNHEGGKWQRPTWSAHFSSPLQPSDASALFWARCSCTQPPAELRGGNSQKEWCKRWGERQRHRERTLANADTISGYKSP